MPPQNIILDNDNTRTFQEIVSCYSIEIPKVQRDYVQGRDTNHAENVRKNLITDIANAVAGTPIDLGFVYGKITSDNRLIPLDGQQRLTLLFLLHLFAFANDPECDWLEKFTYETRHSSKRFIEELVNNRAEIFTGKPSEIIVDAAWFQAEWLFDPTVQSMLVLLDDIKEKFNSDEANLSEQLTTERKVTVMFLPMKELGLEDSLYIKLNARGLPLTVWENEKTLLVHQASEVWSEGGAKEFEIKLDTCWTDLFWEQAGKDKFDTAFSQFFKVQMGNYNIQEVSDLTAEDLNAFRYCLDYLCKNPQNNEALETFKNCCIGNCTYPDRILFHAITVYLSQSKGVNQDSTFAVWMRVFKNLVHNTVFNNEGDYRSACEGISKQGRFFVRLLDHLAADEKPGLSGFHVKQMEEERLKAKLLVKGTERLQNLMYKAEEHQYFEGNIAGILSFAGYDISSTESDAEDNDKAGALEAYSAKMALLFSDKGLLYDAILFRRALLAYGDYLLPQGPNWSFCADAKASRVSWKVLLQAGGKRDLFKQLLDDLDFQQDVVGQLQEIVNTVQLETTDWRFPFVKIANQVETFLGYIGGTSWAIRYDHNWYRISILTGQAMHGNWHCAAILALSFELNAINIRNQYHYGWGGDWSLKRWYLDGFEENLGISEIAFYGQEFEMVQNGESQKLGTIEEILNVIRGIA